MNFLKKIILTVVALTIVASLSLTLIGCPPAAPVVEETTPEETTPAEEETTEEELVEVRKPMVFDLYYPTGNMVRMQSYPLIWQNLSAIGIDVRGQIMDWPTLESHVFPEDRKVEPDDYDTYLMGWGLSIDPDAAVIWASKGEWPEGYNTYGYLNEKTDELWEEGVLYVDQEKRKEVYFELEKILAEELPTIFLYNQNAIVAVNDRVKNPKVFSGLGGYEAAAITFDIFNISTPDDILTLAQWSAPSGPFDPTLLEDEYTDNMADVIYEGLTAYDENYGFIPWLAKSWEISDDQKEVTFYLREGITWHDGEPFTAEDVAFTFHLIGDPEYTGVRYPEVCEPILGAPAYNDGTADSIEGIEVIDPLTIKFTFEDVFAPALESCGFQVLPKHIYEGNIGAAQRDFTTAADFVPIGTGPYKWVIYETDQYVEVARNEDWWGYELKMGANGEGTGEGPSIDTIFFKIMDQQTGLAAFLAKEVDAASVPIDEYDMIAEVEFAQMFEVPDFGFQHFALNQYKAPFNDVKFRQAVAMAIDRQGLVDFILDGHGGIQPAIIAVTSWAHNPDVKPFPYDPVAANALLDEAGYTDEDGDGIREYVVMEPKK